MEAQILEPLPRHESASSGTTSTSVKTVRGVPNRGLAESVLDRFRDLRRERGPASFKTNLDQQDGTDTDLTSKTRSKSGIKRWLLGTRPRPAKISVLSHHETRESDPVLSRRRPEPEGELKSRNPWDAPTNLQRSQKETKDHGLDQWDNLEGVFPTSPELLDFPPPPPRIVRQKEGTAERSQKRDRNSEGKLVQGRAQENGDRTVGRKEQTPFPKRTRSILNERTFITTPRYSSPSFTPSRSRPPSRSRSPSSVLNDASSFSPSSGGPSSLSINNPSASSLGIVKPHSYHSSPDADTGAMSTPSRPGWSRLSNPLPLPPGWKFQIGSTLPTREPNHNHSRTPSHRDSLRASRPHSPRSTESIKRSPRHQHRRSPSPRPSRPSSIRDHRSNHNPRSASFSSLESIVGGNSSESDSTSDADVAIEVIVEPRSNRSQLSLASWPYSPEHPPSPCSSHSRLPS